MIQMIGILVLLPWLVAVAFAEPSISASLSESVTDVDHPVQLEVKVENARVARPPTVSASGLSINFAGTSSHTQILNFHASSITTFVYVVTPTREGVFEIAPIEVSASGKTYRTASLTLKVVHENGNSAGQPTNSDKPYFGELVIPKKSAYVGEQIPIELRFYFNQRIQYQPYPQGQYPLIDGEGFVTKRYLEPTEKQFETNGRIYHVVVYKTGLTGVKPGRLELASATQSFLISAPFGMRGAPGFIDPTEDFQQQVVDVKTNGASLEIKPLPLAGRPPNFSGAVGDFSIASSAQPAKARTGDPVSLKVEIKGLGNFDRMEPPMLTNTEGWRTYRPSEDTQILDDLGLSAVKSFSFPLVAAKRVNTTPTAEFCYFDPNAEKYVTLKSTPISMEIEGEQLPNLEVAPPAAVASTSPTIRSPTVPDVLDIRTRLATGASFLPLTKQPGFWVGQAIPAGVLLLLGLGVWVRKVSVAYEPSRTLNREKRLLWKTIDGSDSRPEVLQAAVRLLELNSGGKRPTLQSLEEAIRAMTVPEDLRRDIRELVDLRSATVYGHLGPQSLTENERTRVKSILNRWKTAA